MTTRELFKRRVIELIHWLPYDEAIKRESVNIKCECWYKFKNWEELIWTTYKMFSRNLQESVVETEILGLPITIWRVMKVFYILQWYEGYEHIYINSNWELFKLGKIYTLNRLELLPIWVSWKTTNEYGAECTDDDQTDETIKKLYKLIK